MSYPPGVDHNSGQRIHIDKFRKVGIPYSRYNWEMGLGYEHRWVVQCTEEELSMLVLLTGATIIENLTETYRTSDLDKLSDDKKEAVGL